MLLELLCIRSSSSPILTCVKVCNWTVGVVDNLYVIAECCLDKANPLGVDFGWVGKVYIPAVIGSTVETNRFGKTMTDCWCSNRGYLVCINFHGRITTVARNRDRVRRHCLDLLVLSVLEIHVENLYGLRSFHK